MSVPSEAASPSSARPRRVVLVRGDGADLGEKLLNGRYGVRAPRTGDIDDDTDSDDSPGRHPPGRGSATR